MIFALAYTDKTTKENFEIMPNWPKALSGEA